MVNKNIYIAIAMVLAIILVVDGVLIIISQGPQTTDELPSGGETETPGLEEPVSGANVGDTIANIGDTLSDASDTLNSIENKLK